MTCLWAEGKGHGAKVIKGMRKAREYFDDMSARAADQKCFFATTCPMTRRLLKEYTCDNRGLKIPVVNHFRDLGCHLTLDDTASVSTLTQRIKRAIIIIGRLKWCGPSWDDKVK